MKERILEFLKTENKSSAQFAEEIGVQPSGISHILSGRNNPSLDFVMKMIGKYQFLSADWLLFGKGSMYKEKTIPTLFDQNSGILLENNINSGQNEKNKPVLNNTMIGKEKILKENEAHEKQRVAKIERIVWFYDNNTFAEYFPMVAE